jgi:integrase
LVPERGKLEDATLISVLAYAGPRPAEAYEHLTWADVGEQIIFRGEKTGKDRSTRLLEPLRDDLRAFRGLSEGRGKGGPSNPAARTRGRRTSPLAESTNVVSLGRGPIFGWSTTRFNSWRDDGAWRKMVDDLDLLIAGKRARPYDLRHAFATLLLGEGTRLPELADQMGNSLAVCQRWYAHLDNIGEQQGASERVWAAGRQHWATLPVPSRRPVTHRRGSPGKGSGRRCPHTKL